MSLEHICRLAKSPGFVRIVESDGGKPAALVIANRLLDHVVLEIADARELYAALREFSNMGLLEG